jgi:hypothetical protein
MVFSLATRYYTKNRTKIQVKTKIYEPAAKIRLYSELLYCPAK